VRVRKARCSARSRSSNAASEAKQNFACNVPATTARFNRPPLTLFLGTQLADGPAINNLRNSLPTQFRKMSV
jgi:hypothetical protein